MNKVRRTQANTPHSTGAWAACAAAGVAALELNGDNSVVTTRLTRPTGAGVAAPGSAVLRVCDDGGVEVVVDATSARG